MVVVVVVVVVVPDVVVHWWAGQTEYTHTLPSPSHSLIKSCHLDTAFGRGGSRSVILSLVTSRRRCVGRQRRPTTSLLIHRRLTPEAPVLVAPHVSQPHTSGITATCLTRSWHQKHGRVASACRITAPGCSCQATLSAWHLMWI